VGAAGYVVQLSQETRSLASEYRRLLARTEKLSARNGELASQVSEQTRLIESRREELRSAESTASGIDALLADLVLRLEHFVEDGVPFLLEERRARIQRLRTFLASSATAVDKYGRILEAYQIEEEYGRTVDVYAGKLAADERPVELLRIGNVLLLYHARVGSGTGYWNTEQKVWVADDDYEKAVLKGIRIANKKDAPDLIVAPIPAPRSRTEVKR